MTQLISAEAAAILADFNAADSDQDGKLSRAEWLSQFQGVDADGSAFLMCDQDNDGTVSKTEVAFMAVSSGAVPESMARRVQLSATDALPASALLPKTQLELAKTPSAELDRWRAEQRAVQRRASGSKMAGAVWAGDVDVKALKMAQHDQRMAAAIAQVAAESGQMPGAGEGLSGPAASAHEQAAMDRAAVHTELYELEKEGRRMAQLADQGEQMLEINRIPTGSRNHWQAGMQQKLADEQ